MHILHVEDDLLVQKAVARLLRPNRITSVASVTDAIVCLGAVQFGVVITDYNLVGPQTGGDLIRWIKLHLPHMGPRTILFSGNPDAAQCCARVVLKPDLGELRLQLAQLL